MPKLTGHKMADAGPKPPDFELSIQQERVIDFVKHEEGNAVVIAVAGSGKTTTLVEVCKHIQGSAVFAAFNKKIADEIGAKLIASGVTKKSVRSGTFHSFGFGAWRQSASGVRVDGDKIWNLMKEMGVEYRLTGFIKQAVSIAKQHGVGAFPGLDIHDHSVWQAFVDHHELDEKITVEDSGSDIETLVEQAIETAMLVLAESNRWDSDVIDFDDMLYSPLLHNVRFRQKDWVLIDEAQDTNPVRREIAKRMLAPDGRMIAVGDPGQAIYGFTGADADAIELIKKEFSPCIELPLTVSYRCPTEVVRHAQRWVSHIQAAPEAPPGLVHQMDWSKFRTVTPEPDSVILCRITRPLVKLAFEYIRHRVPCHIEGRDIGRMLINLSKKWKSVYTVNDLIIKLQEFKAQEEERLKEKQWRLAAIYDKIDTLIFICNTHSLDEKASAVSKTIHDLFRDTESVGDSPVKTKKQSITLSTIHKAKGREWPRVYLLGRNKWMPHPMATLLWQIEQEHNLCYVAVTRTMSELIEVVMPIGGNR